MRAPANELLGGGLRSQSSFLVSISLKVWLYTFQSLCHQGDILIPLLSIAISEALQYLRIAAYTVQDCSPNTMLDAVVWTKCSEILQV